MSHNGKRLFLAVCYVKFKSVSHKHLRLIIMILERQNLGTNNITVDRDWLSFAMPATESGMMPMLLFPGTP